MIEIDQLNKALTHRFKAAANPTYAKKMKSYMRNLFDFYGLKAEWRRRIQKEFWAVHTLPTKEEDFQAFIKSLWEQPYRELHYQAIDLLEKLPQKAEANWIPFFEYLITHQSWWDTVDPLATKLVGQYLEKYPTQAAIHPDQWIVSEHLWLRRTAILYQLKYKDATNWQRLQGYILATSEEKAFFIQKAAAWSLREYSKTNAQAVLDFVNNYENVLSGLTKREALKWLKNKGRI